MSRSLYLPSQCLDHWVAQPNFEHSVKPQRVLMVCVFFCGRHRFKISGFKVGLEFGYPIFLVINGLSAKNHSEISLHICVCLFCSPRRAEQTAHAMQVQEFHASSLCWHGHIDQPHRQLSKEESSAQHKQLQAPLEAGASSIDLLQWFSCYVQWHSPVNSDNYTDT